tara:strand:+ start:226 stop:453 length:228 start_codon:yes stop_codon:yes gene_type:complete
MKDLNQDQKFNMKKNLTLYIFLILAIIALYISTKTYKNFSLDKSIRACVISQLKKNNDMNSKQAEKFCLEQIKIK